MVIIMAYNLFHYGSDNNRSLLANQFSIQRYPTIISLLCIIEKVYSLSRTQIIRERMNITCNNYF